MRTITIIYQTDRKYIARVQMYYPEDNKTPKQRVKYIKDNSLLLTENFTVISACPYIIEAVYKVFGHKDTKIECFIDQSKVEGLNDIFKLLAEPMKELMMYNF